MAEFIESALDSVARSAEEIRISSLDINIKIPDITTNLESAFEKIGMEGQKFDIIKLDDGSVEIKNSKGEIIDYKSANEKNAERAIRLIAIPMIINTEIEIK